MKKQTTILITGASRGIGYDTALQLAKNSANQIYVLSRNEKKLKTLQQAANSKNIHIIPFDLADFDEEKLSAAFKKIKRIDILINNAGLLINEPFETLSIAKWRMIFEVNLFGVVQLIQNLLPQLTNSKNAHIVNIGSMGGIQGSSK